MHIFAWSPNPYAPKHRRRPMVTPVHRFQQIESMLIDPRDRFDGARGRYGRGRRWGSRSRLPRCTEEAGSRSRGRLPDAATASPLSQERDISSSESPSVSTPRHRQSFPNNFNRFRMRGINWGLWGCFIVVTTLLIPAHIYLKQYAYRGELMGVFFVITLLFLVCFSVSMFHTKTRAILLHRLHLEEEMRGCSSETNTPPTSNDRCQQLINLQPCLPRELEMAGSQVRESRSTPDLQLNGDMRIRNEDGNRIPHHGVIRSISETSRGSDASPAWDPFGEPPPYDVAVLLPTPSCEEIEWFRETPPPAYDVIQ